MSNLARHVSNKVTPQTSPIPGRADQVINSEGGHVFAVDKWTRLDRFLILGSEGGSFYASERKLTIENAKCIEECLAENAVRTVRTIADISHAGRAPKNGPAIFALAIAAAKGHLDLVAEMLPRVCRTGTHLLEFVGAVDQMRGWGRAMKRAVAGWYTGTDPNRLAYQMVKYQSRGGWSHADVLRLVHAVAPTPAHDAAFRWATSGHESLSKVREVKRSTKGQKPSDGIVASYGATPVVPRLIQAHEEAKKADSARLVQLITDDNLPRECIPTERLNDVAVWDALLQKMPMTAMIRNLGKMTSIGLLKPLSAATKMVTDRLGDADYLRKSRIHPLAVLIALKTYGSNRGLKGSLTWNSVPTVNDALDAAFYATFGNVVPAGKRTLMGLDVSGSMSSLIANSSISCAEGAAAMAMIFAKSEPQYDLMAFHHGFQRINLSGRSRLAEVLQVASNINCGGTDCSLPMTYAIQNKLEVDTFMVWTDSETYFGNIHPCQALKQYRNQSGINARLIVVGMAASEFTIADPTDGGSLDVVGFDSSVPVVINDFSRGAREVAQESDEE